jgi:multidrug transporter EmrE-like cation transporter
MEQVEGTPGIYKGKRKESRSMSVFWLTCAVLFNTVANGLLKAGATIPQLSSRKGVMIGAGLFIGLLNTLCYIKALEKIDLGIAYPVFSAASILLIGGISFFVFREGMSTQKVVGLVTICAGILLTWKG